MRVHGPTRFEGILAIVVSMLLGAPVVAQDSGPPPPPGFRPPSPQAAAFAETWADAPIVVLPTVVRTPDGATHSLASQGLLVDLLHEGGFAGVRASEARVEPGAAPHVSQWEIFQRSMHAVAAWAREDVVPGGYVLLMELVLPPGAPRVFGIQTYILDGAGRNVFSFLLNAHHSLFREAALVATDDSEAARAALVAAATRVGVTALEAQLHHVTACAAWMAAHPPVPSREGVFEDFEDGIAMARDAHGIPLGFSTFTDGRSGVSLETTDDHPPRRGEPPGNVVLRVELNVTGWAGFTDLARDSVTGLWQARDWSAFDGLTLWMHGTDTGTGLFVDILDNRNPCSVEDDAERWVYEFADDFTGWKQVRIPFREMVRKEIGNGAPDDGLGLSSVHGWAFGATNTDGPRTWYLDDVGLWRAGPG